MNKIAFVVGLVAVVFYLLCFQQKKRKQIILFNIITRLLFIIQYVLLSAFEGAVLDIAGIIASFCAQKKHTSFIKKHMKLVVSGVNIIIVIMGLFVYKNIYSMLPIGAVMLQTGALWLDDEKHIRQLSFFGGPVWFVYNFISGAYGSCIADILSTISIGIAMLRLDMNGKSDTKKGVRNL